MKIGVDGMGGDYAPEEIVQGIIQAKQRGGPDIVITGDQLQLEKAFSNHGGIPKGVEIVATTQIVSMDESPSRVIREKKDSSLVVGAKMVKEGKTHALIAAGNTGAAMACGIFVIGRLNGVDRPGIAIPVPGIEKMSLLIDGGANSEIKPYHLVQFARMGTIYMEKVLHRNRPKVGLLNVGEEEKKGSPLYQEGLQLLKEADINLMGNLEGRHLFTGTADVVVCDGFVGNITLKVMEGTAQAIIEILKAEVDKSFRAKIGALLMKGALRAMKGKMDYEEYGGAPLLGLTAPLIICHGSSKAKAIANAIFVAQEMVTTNTIGAIEQSI